MKRFVLLAAIPITVFSCTSVDEIDNRIIDGNAHEIYDTQSKIWITQQNDPYRIDTSVATKGNPNGNYYALTIHPKSLMEQRALERMSDIRISYIPFGYSYSHQDPFIVSSESICLAEAPHECCDISTVGIEDPLPTLYVSWPHNKPIPDSLSYSIDYEVYLPNDTDTKDQTNQRIRRFGRIQFEDTFWGSPISIPGVRCRFQYGSLIQDVYTNSQGVFTVPLNMHDSTTVSYVLQGSDWTISDDNSTVPTIKYLGKLANLWGASSFKSFTVSGLHETAYRAAHYLYTTSFPGFTLPLMSDITIKIQSSPSFNWGEFYKNANPPYIKIYPHGPSWGDNEVISTTLHELGHAMQYTAKGATPSDNTPYTNVETIIRESFASFSGWYFGEKYYESLGWVNSSPSNHINHNNRQSWTGNDTLDVYSPIFIDINDSHNQHTVSIDYLDDNVSSLPVDEVLYLAGRFDTIFDLTGYLRSSQSYRVYWDEEDIFPYTNKYRQWTYLFTQYP